MHFFSFPLNCLPRLIYHLLKQYVGAKQPIDAMDRIQPDRIKSTIIISRFVVLIKSLPWRWDMENRLNESSIHGWLLLFRFDFVPDGFCNLCRNCITDSSLLNFLDLSFIESIIESICNTIIRIAFFLWESRLHLHKRCQTSIWSNAIDN